MAITKRKETTENAQKAPVATNRENPAPAAPPAPSTEPPKEPALPTTVVPPAGAPADAPDNKAPVSVPAPKTELQLLSEKFHAQLSTDVLPSWYSGRPVVSTWVEPTADQKKAMIRNLIKERGIDPTEDYDGVAAAKAEIDALITADRNAAGISKQDSIDCLYLEAAYNAFISAATVARMALESRGGKVHRALGTSSSTGSKPRTSPGKTRGRKANWSQKNPAMIKWANDLGIPDLVLVDQTIGGYEGQYHAVMALPDGRWERVNFNSLDDTYTRTGEVYDKPVWFTNENGEKPSYAAQQMYHLLMRNSKGAVVSVPGVSIDNRVARGDMSALYRELGFSRVK